jgi:hypothetical protein
MEYLIALLLKSFRLKDKIRISELLQKADKKTLEEIIKRHDNETDKLWIKYQQLLKTLQEGQS